MFPGPDVPDSRRAGKGPLGAEGGIHHRAASRAGAALRNLQVLRFAVLWRLCDLLFLRLSQTVT
ncbi:hypothetical protein GCM10020295_42040 [Streptomyces cinereospinus]